MPDDKWSDPVPPAASDLTTPDDMAVDEADIPESADRPAPLPGNPYQAHDLAHLPTSRPAPRPISSGPPADATAAIPGARVAQNPAFDDSVRAEALKAAMEGKDISVDETQDVLGRLAERNQALLAQHSTDLADGEFVELHTYGDGSIIVWRWEPGADETQIGRWVEVAKYASEPVPPAVERDGVTVPA